MRDGCVNRIKFSLLCFSQDMKITRSFRFNSCACDQFVFSLPQKKWEGIEFVFFFLFIILVFISFYWEINLSFCDARAQHSLVSDLHYPIKLETTPKVFDAIMAIPVAKQLRAQSFSRARSSLTRHMHLNRHDTCIIRCLQRSQKLSSNHSKTFLELIHMISLLHCGTFVLLDIK